MSELFGKYRPNIVFHAAALKHLTELESDPFAALETNVLGTLRLLKMAEVSGVECFVNVSSDKAVNPTSVMGVSKRIAELILATEPAAPRRVSLRLGNVLGSSGSFVPLFMRHLEEGRSPCITDPRASRYFVSPDEAAAFLMQSIAALAGPLLLPEMGGPQRIIELANFLLEESYGSAAGLSPRFTGLRDGEKLCEELTYDYEILEDSSVPQIRKIGGNSIFDAGQFAGKLTRLIDLVLRRHKSGLVRTLCSMVPEFVPSPTFLSYVH